MRSLSYSFTRRRWVRRSRKSSVGARAPSDSWNWQSPVPTVLTAICCLVAFIEPQGSFRNVAVIARQLYALWIWPSTTRSQWFRRTTPRGCCFWKYLHPVLESRTKEALWIGDLDLALSRALQVIDLDPYDLKAWLELGQVRLKRSETAQAAEAYATAAVLGPPASAVARGIWPGTASVILVSLWLPRFFFLSALEVDPLAISPHDQIQALPTFHVSIALKEWNSVRSNSEQPKRPAAGRFHLRRNVGIRADSGPS